jgi:hypothetical protein
MDVQIRVAEGPGDELAALGEWLGRDGELSGRVQLRGCPVGDTDRGPVPGLLIVTLAAGGTGKVLASSVLTWLRFGRTTTRITVESGGHRVTLDTQTAGETGPLLEQILRVGNAGAALADVRRTQTGRLIDHVVLAAHLSGDEDLKTHVLVQAAATLAATDPDRAEHIARSITVESQQGSALGNVVEALIPADLNRARHVGKSIADDYTRQSALGQIAAALAATDPDQAIQLIDRSITIDQPKASALGRVAWVLAATDPGQAERVALSIADDYTRQSALGDIACVLAATDPDEAERVAREIPDGFAQASALGDIAESVAPADPDRAERIARSITGEYKEFVQCRVARELAGTDPDRGGRLIDDAEHSARAIASEELKELAFGWIAEVLATADPSRAERIAREITDEGRRAATLFFLTVELASADPDQAERIARSITGKGYWHTLETWSAAALRHVAEALAATDPDRAERIAWSVTGGATEQDSSGSSSSSWYITSERAKAWALGGVARVLTATDPDRAARLIADAEQLALSATDERVRIDALLYTAKAFSIGPAPHDGPPGDRSTAVTIHLMILRRNTPAARIKPGQCSRPLGLSRHPRLARAPRSRQVTEKPVKYPLALAPVPDHSREMRNRPDTGVLAGPLDGDYQRPADKKVRAGGNHAVQHATIGALLNLPHVIPAPGQRVQHVRQDQADWPLP